MRSKQTTVAIILLVLLAVVGYGLFATSRPVASPATNAASASIVAGTSAVDQQSLNTALRLVRLHTTADEAALAQEALRLGDKEMDLAFADAVHAAARQRQTTPEVQVMEARLKTAQDGLAADQARVAQLSAAAGSATGANKATLDDRLSLIRARLELDQDEIDDAKQDLMRAGGDPQGRMQALMDEHEASSKGADSTRIAITPPTTPPGLVRQLQAWSSLQQKETQLRNAKAAAESASVVFAKQHGAIEQQPVAPDDSAPATTAGLSHDSSDALLRATRRRAAEQKAQARLDQHAENQRGLANVYGLWMSVVRGQQRTMLNQALRGIGIILLIALLALLVDRWIEHLLRTTSTDQRRTQTLCIVVRVTLQVVGVLLVLLVVFGAPGNVGTMLGLAGAGLTVALKDFIIGFLGWFVLLGKDGIGIGDLVEINGVTGEVVEIGIFHTVLLETGHWSDSGHLTGRRVTFTNSFAIEGHYFNFSTSGQWLWDEVQIVVPDGRDPYPIARALQQHVEAATAGSAGRAEREWTGRTRSARVSALAAAPATNIKPIVGGMEITVRYLAHVQERSALRADLYHTAVDLLSEARATPATAMVTPSVSPTR